MLVEPVLKTFNVIWSIIGALPLSIQSFLQMVFVVIVASTLFWWVYGARDGGKGGS